MDKKPYNHIQIKFLAMQITNNNYVLIYLL